jgi:CPA1 family monovalent cation:H+ antiporter
LSRRVVEHVEVQVLILLLIASFVGMGARRIRLPYTLALVVAGLGLSFVHLDALHGLALTPELLLLLFLPPLLFEAAYHLPFDELRRNAVHIGFLAVVGVCLAVCISGVLAFYAINALAPSKGFTWAHAFLFAAVIAATDPISVLALFKEMGAPKRLYQVVEGESLINDGVAVVVFAIVAAIFGVDVAHVTTGEAQLHSTREIIVFAVLTFIKTGLGGLLTGAAIGAVTSFLTRAIDDHLIETTLTTLVAWGSFLVAETLHVNGVLSTVAAGVMMGSFGKVFGMSASTRIAVRDFWNYMGFLSNSFIFLLIGVELEPTQLVEHLPIVVAGFVSLLVARAVIIYGGLPLADRIRRPLPKVWRHVLVWGGLRGSLSMVLILGLPSDFAGRQLLIDVVFGVVALSLFVQGLTMGPLMKKLGITAHEGLAIGRDYEVARGRAIAFRRVLNEAERLVEQGLLDEHTHRRVAGFYDRQRERSQQTARELAGKTSQPEALLEAARTFGVLEREAIEAAVHAGVVHEDAAAELSTDLDARLDALDRAAHDSEAALISTFEERYPEPEES